MTQSRGIQALISLYGIRMLGLFMVMPVLMLFGESLDGATPFLLGLAMGAYGLTQAIFQIPLGSWSDKIGRKPVILIGLGIFALGSVIAATADHVYGLIIGRFLQGAGAIASTLMAFAADLTKEEERTKTMAKIGMSIGMAFAIALILGPAISGWGGLRALFWGIFALTILAFLVATISLPGLPPQKSERTDLNGWSQILLTPSLMKLNISVFTLHAIMVALFIVVPAKLQNHLLPSDHWQVYLPVLVLSFVVMVPLLILAERKGLGRQVRVAAIGLIAVSQWWLIGEQPSLSDLVIGMWVFFCGFNVLEAALPSELSKQAPENRRGAAMGVFSTCQFLGAFVGGLVGGLLAEANNQDLMLMMISLLSLPWLVLMKGSKKPKKPNEFQASQQILDRITANGGLESLEQRQLETVSVSEQLAERKNSSIVN